MHVYNQSLAVSKQSVAVLVASTVYHELFDHKITQLVNEVPATAHPLP